MLIKPHEFSYKHYFITNYISDDYIVMGVIPGARPLFCKILDLRETDMNILSQNIENPRASVVKRGDLMDLWIKFRYDMPTVNILSRNVQTIKGLIR